MKRLTEGEARERLQELSTRWSLENGKLGCTYTFPDFLSALEFTNRIGAVAEDLQHHPDIYLTWGKVRLEIFTHDANGLTEKDFILAKKIDALS